MTLWSTYPVPVAVTYTAVTLGPSGVAATNVNSYPVVVTVAGGAVSGIKVNGATTGLTSGAFVVPGGGTITVTYTSAPTTFRSISRMSPFLQPNGSLPVPAWREA